MNRFILLNITLALVILFIAGDAAAGTIEGKVTVVKYRTNADAVVYIDAIPDTTFDPPAEPAEMDQKDLLFVPRILPILVGTTVNFLNNDPVLHNVFTPDKIGDRFNLGSYPMGEVRSHTFTKLGGAAVILCNVHPEMEAYIVVLPTPYFAVTDKDGNYRIEGVPAGTYTLKVWHDRWKFRPPQTVTVSETGKVTVDFEIKRRK